VNVNMMVNNNCINVKNVIMLKRDPGVFVKTMRIMLIALSVINEDGMR
jgi:hypothetical protein